MQTYTWKMFLMLLVLTVGSVANADERFDGNTTIDGQGEARAVPDVTVMSVTLDLSCWADFGGLQAAADKFHDDILSEVKKTVSKSDHRYSAPGVNLFPQNLTMEKEVEVKGDIQVRQVADPECTNVNGAKETIELTYNADFLKREQAIKENPELTGFEEVAEIRNRLAKIIGSHVNREKKNGVRATLNVDYKLSAKYLRNLRDEARLAADADYAKQYEVRKKFCGWIQAKKVSVSYSGGDPDYSRNERGGYAKRSLSTETAPIGASSLNPGETPVPASVSVTLAYQAKTENCQLP